MAASSIGISINLKEVALYELEFLKSVYHDQFLRIPLVIANAVYRYEHIWLPFLKQHSSDEVGDLEYAAPQDVLWIWHTHMLSPLNYKQNCNQLFQRVFGHQLNSAELLRQKRAKTKLLWETEYPGEPYDVIRTKRVPTRNPKSQIQYDLISATKRQELFYYQVMVILVQTANL